MGIERKENPWQIFMPLNTVCGMQFTGFGFCVGDLICIICAYVHSSGMSVSHHVFCHLTQQAGQTRIQFYNALILKFPSKEVNKVYLDQIRLVLCTFEA